MDIAIVEKRAERAAGWLLAAALFLAVHAVTVLDIPIQAAAGNMGLAVLSFRLAPWLGLLAFLLSLVARVLFLLWVHGSNRLAHGIAEGAVSVSPFASVGWFFAPIFSWWMPFVGVRECYQASVAPDAPELVAVPRVMRVWWGSFVAYSLLAGLSVIPRLAGLDRGPGSAAALMAAGSELLYVPMAFTAMRVVRLLTQAERTAVGTDPSLARADAAC